MTAPTPTPRRWPKLLAAILLVLVLAAVAAGLTLDRFLTSAARDQAAKISERWGRPVEIGAVKTTVLSGLGVRIEGIRIAAAAGEPRPLLELDRAEVKLELLRALTSRGRDLRVRSAELQGLRVTVVRLQDGTTNAQALAAAMARGAPAASPAVAGPAPAEASPAPAKASPSDLSMVRVEHAALRGARIAFLDGSAGGRELLIDQIDLELDGLAAGAPLDLTLKAGVLSATQNLVLKVHAPPLPASLVPVPDRLTLQVTPVDLTPLAPFMPRGAGFQGGRFSADLEVALGAAVSGGAGPTTIRGGFAATGLRFTGQEGGKALDVTLDADLSADALQGDLTITKLLLAFGPAALEGKGRVIGLRSERPAIEGLRITSRNLDLATLAAFYPPLPRLLGGTVAGPMALSLEAAGSAAQPVIELRADLTPVRLAFARRFDKAAGGRLVMSARLRSGVKGALRFDVEGDLGGLDLRPGGSLAKKPGDRFTVSGSGSRVVGGEVQTLEVSALALALVDLDLKAHGRLELAPAATRFDLAVTIDRLDADRLLLPAPPPTPPTPPAPAEPGGAAVGAASAPAGPSPYQGLSGRCSLRIGEATAGKQKASDLRATIAVKEDQVTIEEGRLLVWGGSLDLAGTQVRLAPPDRPFSLSARAEGVQVGAALATWSEQKVLEGRLDALIRLSGRGDDGAAIRKALDGTVEGKLFDGVFHGADLVAGVTEPLVKAVPALQGKAPRAGTTSLGTVVPVSLRIQGGRALLQKPLEIEDRGAMATVRGAVGLDGELEMPVELSLPPAVIAELSGGKVRLQAPLPFAFTLQGKAWRPRLAGLEVGPAARRLAESLGVQALGKALGLGGASKPGGPGAPADGKEKPKEEPGAAKKNLEQDARKALKKLFGG
jgi:AsmA protein